ncbi:hypothetical protein EOM81_13425 [bacterium]|nr:hypothetical protein [bacterium]
MSKSNKTTPSNKGSKASPKGSGSTKSQKTTNYGLGSRNIVIAAKNALSRAGKSFSSVATISQRFSNFASFAKETANIKLMEQVTRETVLNR